MVIRWLGIEARDDLAPVPTAGIAITNVPKAGGTVQRLALFDLDNALDHC
jgi:hypothetical protein